MADTLTTQLNFKTLHQQVDDVLRYDNVPEANNLRSGIKKALKDPNIDPAIAKDLNKYLGLLNWVCILSISDEVLFSQLKTHIQDSYSIPDYELEEKITDRFSLLDFPEDGAEFLTGVTGALEANTEKLGNQTIGGWIKLYAASGANAPGKGGFDQVQFLQKNGAGLDENQKVILLEVFKIYDSGKSWLAKYNALPVAQSDADIPDDVVLNVLYGGDETPAKTAAPASRPVSIDGLKPQQSRPQPPQQTVASQPKPRLSEPTQIAPAPISPASSEQKSPPTTDEIVENIKRQEANPETVSRLQELLHKTPQQSNQATSPNQSPPQPTVNIDDKLSELKKRLNSNE